MNIEALNNALALGNIDQKGLFPHLDQLANAPYVFDVDFGLKVLPTEPGILLIRGARQYGKSTWLEKMLKNTIVEFGAGTAFYLNGDVLLNLNRLENAIEELLTGFRRGAQVKRIFIDEITAIPNWEIALKRMSDQGLLREVLIITTGSNAADIRRGAERLPGRKGKLQRTNYLFTPISYSAFHQACSAVLGKDTFTAYFLSGGSPIACTELAVHRVLPEYVIELVRDWVEGEVTRSGRNRQSLNNLLQILFRFGGTPVAKAKIAREANMANNTVAVGYIDLLSDLSVITPSFPWDQNNGLPILRKGCKHHFSNLLVALTYHPKRLRRIEDFNLLDEAEQGMWLEWLVSQELMRRRAIYSDILFEPQLFWQNQQHELDFVLENKTFLEVKRGGCSPLEFAWFSKQFPHSKLMLVNKNKFETNVITAVTAEEFLLANDY
ncbi:MAG: ATP-binding protein [Gammaproteobacteria bacterium]|nr:ATP-binding protein [Gammaproteobacteria bacterium]